MLFNSSGTDAFPSRRIQKLILKAIFKELITKDDLQENLLETRCEQIANRPTKFEPSQAVYVSITILIVL